MKITEDIEILSEIIGDIKILVKITGVHCEKKT